MNQIFFLSYKLWPDVLILLNPWIEPVEVWGAETCHAMQTYEKTVIWYQSQDQYFVTILALCLSECDYNGVWK